MAKHLEGWHDFYLVIGTGAAALTGLLFVIVSLGPHVVGARATTGVRAFISPVATHFTCALMASAWMLTPGLSAEILGWTLVAAGLAGIVYSLWTGAHQSWREHRLSMLDWIWFVAMPYACFALLAASGLGIAKHDDAGLYGVGFALALLVVVGIRNAWDLVLWVARQPRTEMPEARAGGQSVEGAPGHARHRKGRHG